MLHNCVLWSWIQCFYAMVGVLMAFVFFIFVFWGDTFQNSEIGSLKTNSTDTTMPYDGWYTGAASSSLNDIANDEFTQILHIEEASDDGTSQIEDTDDDAPIMERRLSSTSVAKIRSTLSNNSTANNTDGISGNFVAISVPDTAAITMKPSSSDVSISLLLDADDDDSNESFEDDDDTFGNANVNLLGNPTRKRSSTNASFRLDDEQK